MKRGFTLIELLITVVIGGVLIAGAIAAYRGLGTKQKVKQAGISFQTDLKSYQQKALSGQKPIECGGGDTLSGYGISYVNAETYSVQAVCRTNNPAATQVSLPTDVVFAAAFNPAQIFFPVLKSQAVGAQTITLTLSGQSYQVVIENSGVIRGQML